MSCVVVVVVNRLCVNFRLFCNVLFDVCIDSVRLNLVVWLLGGVVVIWMLFSVRVVLLFCFMMNMCWNSGLWFSV